MRLHRRVIELPGGDLLTTIYGWLEGDNEPSGYTPTMRKTRVMLLRSTNRGSHWDLVSTIAVDPKVGTEGYDEPVLAASRNGPHAGRLICQMRTGRELRESHVRRRRPHLDARSAASLCDLDVYRTDLWAEMFRGFKRNNQLIAETPNEYIGAVVDPDLLELRSGVLVAAFGVPHSAAGLLDDSEASLERKLSGVQPRSRRHLEPRRPTDVGRLHDALHGRRRDAARQPALRGLRFWPLALQGRPLHVRPAAADFGPEGISRGQVAKRHQLPAF